MPMAWPPYLTAVTQIQFVPTCSDQSFQLGRLCGQVSGPPRTPGIPKILTDLELEVYKEASHTMPYPTSRSPGKRVLVLTGEISTSVVSGKTHSTVTSLRTGAMAFFRDLTICWAGSEHRLGTSVSRGLSRRGAQRPGGYDHAGV